MATTNTTSPDYYSLLSTPNHLATYEQYENRAQKERENNYNILIKEAHAAFERRQNLIFTQIPGLLTEGKQLMETTEEWEESRRLVNSYFDEATLESTLKDDEEFDRLEKESDDGYAKLIGDIKNNGGSEIDIEAANASSGIGSRIENKKAVRDHFDNLSHWMAYSGDKFTVPYKGKMVTFNQARASGDPAMYAAVKKAYHVNYVRSLVKAGYSKGQIRKYFVKPLIERDRQEKVAWLQEHEKIAEGVNKFNRGEELLEGIIANPQTGLTDWVEKHYGYHNNSWHLAKQEAAKFIEDALMTGRLTPAQVEGILNQEFKAHDGSIQTPGKYFPEFAGLRAKAQQMISQQLDAKIQARKDAIKLITLKRQTEDKVPRDLEGFKDYVDEAERQDIEQFEEVTPYVNKLKERYKQMDTLHQESIMTPLMARIRAGGEITKADLEGLNDDNWEKMMVYVKNPISKDNRDKLNERIKARVNRITQENFTTQEKTEKWLNLYDNAQKFFEDQYINEIRDHNNPTLAFSKAYEATLNEFDVKGEKWQEFSFLDSDENESRKRQFTHNLLREDAYLQRYKHMYSDKPLPGETEELLNGALEYINNPYVTEPPPEFKAWANNTQLVDESGYPITPKSYIIKRLESLGLLPKTKRPPNKNTNKFLRSAVRYPTPSNKIQYQIQEGEEFPYELFDVQPLDDIDKENLGSYFTGFNDPATLSLPLLRYMSEETQPTQ